MNHKKYLKVEKNWLIAAKEFNFEIITPFKFINQHKEKTIFAFLPFIGSEKGMIIDLIYPPDFSTDIEIVKWANENGYFYSFINIEGYLNYDKKVFNETLKDWGYYKIKKLKNVFINLIIV